MAGNKLRFAQICIITLGQFRTFLRYRHKGDLSGNTVFHLQGDHLRGTALHRNRALGDIARIRNGIGQIVGAGSFHRCQVGYNIDVILVQIIQNGTITFQ